MTRAPGALVELIAALPGPVLFPLHPRTRARLRDGGLLAGLRALEGSTLTEPLGYIEFSALLCQARAPCSPTPGASRRRRTLPGCPA